MITFYRQSPSVFIVNDTPSNPTQYYCLIKGNNLQIYTTGSAFKLHDSPYTEYKKENGDPYESLEVLVSAVEDFTSGNSGSSIILTNPDTGIKTRIVATTTGYRIDITLTELGFEGVESTDNGVTGDWVTTTSA